MFKPIIDVGTMFDLLTWKVWFGQATVAWLFIEHDCNTEISMWNSGIPCYVIFSKQSGHSTQEQVLSEVSSVSCKNNFQYLATLE